MPMTAGCHAMPTPLTAAAVHDAGWGDSNKFYVSAGGWARQDVKEMIGTIDIWGDVAVFEILAMDTWNKIACNDLGGLRAAYLWDKNVSDEPAWRQLIAPVGT